MANLYAFGFEGGVVPSGVTITTGTMRPTVGRRVTDQTHKWGLVASSTTQTQAEISLDLGSARSKVGGSFYFRADNIDYTTPLVLVDFGAVTISLTSSTNLRVFDGTSNTDYTVTAVTNGWNLLQFNIDLAATTDAISTNFNLIGLQKITMGAAITGTDQYLIIRANKGFNSTLEDIRVEDAVANGACPTSIECRKSTLQGAFKNQWTINGTPVAASSSLNILGVCYCHSTNMFYAINNAGSIYKINPETLVSTFISTPNAAYGHCAMVYHQALNIIYFVGNGNVAYLDPTNDSVTEAAQTVYYAQGTHASGAYYEPVSGNAYIVTQKASTSTDSVAIHKIDRSGTYSSTVSTGVYTPLAPITRHFNVCFDTGADEILFPMFASSVIGRCTQAMSFSVSGTDGAFVVRDINDAGGYWGGSGVFLVGSTNTTSRIRTYSSGSIARYQTSTVTNAGASDKGLIYHPTLGVLLFPNATTSGDLYQAVKGNANSVKVATSALPAVTATYLLNQINPVTGGVMYINNNTLSECRLMTDLNVSSLQLKDAKYVQSATNNNEMNLLPSSVINNNTAIIKMNACMKNAFGQGSVSLAGVSKTVIGAGADYCGSVDPLPMPEVLYDADGASSVGDIINLGSGISVPTGLTSIAVGTTGRHAGIKFIIASSVGYFPNPAKSVGTGDFTFAMDYYRTSAASNSAYYFSLGSGVMSITYASVTSSTLSVQGINVLTFTSSLDVPQSIKIGRSAGTLYVYIDGVLAHSMSLAGSITFGSDMHNNGGYAAIKALAFWRTTYISDPNPIAGLNRREIVVTKTA